MAKKKKALPKASNTKELKLISERKLEESFSISSGFEVTKEPLESDNGIDYTIYLIDKDRQISPHRFVCQLKATQKAPRTDSLVLIKNFPVKTINLLKGGTLPAYVFLYENSINTMYWGYLDDVLNLLDKKEVNWTQQETTTLYLNTNNKVNKEGLEKIYNKTKFVCEQLGELITTCNLIEPLKPYFHINLNLANNTKNIHLSPIKNGIKGNFSLKLKTDHAKKFQEAQTKGEPCVVPTDNGKLTLMYEDKEICTLKNIIQIQTIPKGISIELLIPQTEFSIGPFSFIPKNTDTVLLLQTNKDVLPWYVQLSFNKTTKSNGGIQFKFFREYARIQDFIKYLKFMEALSRYKELEIKNPFIRTQKVGFNADKLPNITSEELLYFENLLKIENHLKKIFTLPETIAEDDLENAFVLAELFTKGEVVLPNMTFTFAMLGKSIREQLANLSKKENELIFEVEWQAVLCRELLRCKIKAIIEKAIPDENTDKLFSNPSILQDDKEYSCSYKAKDGTSAKIILIS